MVELFANSGDPDQAPHSVSSDLGLQCLPVNCVGVSSLLWVKLKDEDVHCGYKIISYHIGFLINVQVQGQHPHQWAPFQIAGLLHAWQISLQISRYVYHEG